MRKIFVWKSYGDISVYDGENVSTLKIILNQIIECLEDWDMTDTIEKAITYRDKISDDENEDNCFKCMKAINHLLNAAGIGSHELFEIGTGFTTLRVK